MSQIQTSFSLGLESLHLQLSQKCYTEEHVKGIWIFQHEMNYIQVWNIHSPKVVWNISLAKSAVSWKCQVYLSWCTDVSTIISLSIELRSIFSQNNRMLPMRPGNQPSQNENCSMKYSTNFLHENPKGKYKSSPVN